MAKYRVEETVTVLRYYTYDDVEADSAYDALDKVMGTEPDNVDEEYINTKFTTVEKVGE